MVVVVRERQVSGKRAEYVGATVGFGAGNPLARSVLHYVTRGFTNCGWFFGGEVKTRRVEIFASTPILGHNGPFPLSAGSF